MNLQCLPADPSDIPVIFHQAKDLIDTYEDLASIDYERVLSWVKDKITSNICFYRSVTLDGQKCAYYHLCEDGELDDLYVLPAFRGQGIGSWILDKCIEESEMPLYLYVFLRNTGAIALYEKYGFTIKETVGATRCIMIRNS